MIEDPESGWVERQSIRNIFATALKKLEEIMPVSERWPIRDVVIAHFERTKYEILKKSKTTDEIVPKVKAKKSANEEPIDSKAMHEQRVAKIRTQS